MSLALTEKTKSFFAPAVAAVAFLGAMSLQPYFTQAQNRSAPTTVSNTNANIDRDLAELRRIRDEYSKSAKDAQDLIKINARIEELTRRKSVLESQNKELDKQNAALDKENAVLDQQNAALISQNAELDLQIQEAKKYGFPLNRLTRKAMAESTANAENSKFVYLVVSKGPQDDVYNGKIATARDLGQEFANVLASKGVKYIKVMLGKADTLIPQFDKTRISVVFQGNPSNPSDLAEAKRTVAAAAEKAAAEK